MELLRKNLQVLQVSSTLVTKPSERTIEVFSLQVNQLEPALTQLFQLAAGGAGALRPRGGLPAIAGAAEVAGEPGGNSDVRRRWDG